MPQPVDLHQPLPDEAHEAIRLGIVQALSDLADSFMLLDTLFQLNDGSRADIGLNESDVGDSLLLVGVLFELLDQAVVDAAEAATERDQLRADLDALTGRLAAVEAALAIPTPEQPGGLL